MAEQLPALVILLPLFGALLVTLAGSWKRELCGPLAVLTLQATVVLTGLLLFRLSQVEGHRILYHLGGWKQPVPVGIHLAVDGLNVLVLILIAVVALIAAIYALNAVPKELPEREPMFFTLYLLLVTGLLGMTIAADAFNVFVLLEVASLTSYALISMGDKKRGSLAAFNYLLLGTIGASLYLLGVGYLYAATGTLNMADLREHLTDSPTAQTGFALMMLGLGLKMAIFPLHGWLPNAYTHGPTPSVNLLAPLVTKVNIYVMIRLLVSVFGLEFPFPDEAVVWVGIVAIAAGSVMAFAEKQNLRRMLAYLIVAEVGYMVGGAWLASRWGMTGAVYHILSDAMMTLCLFLAASHLMGKEVNAFRRMPLTAAGFLAGMLGMIGVPPTCGFFSKWYLIRGGIEAGHWPYVAALILSSLVNAVIFFRVLETAYFSPKTAPSAREEAPPGHLLALGLAAAGVVLVGVFNAPIVEVIDGWFMQSQAAG